MYARLYECVCTHALYELGVSMYACVCMYVQMNACLYVCSTCMCLSELDLTPWFITHAHLVCMHIDMAYLHCITDLHYTLIIYLPVCNG